ncbi:MAG TPA: hypothetical protein VN915_01695 [Elusimicrobiota bacterium]|nr:hypothetical protein [Elusimicrobiota bacterium]
MLERTDLPRRALLAAVLAAAAFAPARAAIQLSTATKLAVSNEFLEYDNRVTGSNPSGSFLTPGTHAQESLNLQLNTLAPDGVAYESAFDGRATDDPRIDQKRFNLKRFYVKADTTTASAVVGDFLGSFSDYTLGKSLKGASYTRKTDKTQLTVLGGIDKPNWDDVWNNNADETVDRQVWGARAQRQVGDDGQVGANLVWAKDERSKFNTSAPAVDQRVASLDWTLPRYHKLVLSGESAYALSQIDLPTSDSLGNPIEQHSTQYGWAHKVRARYTYGRFKTVDDFERVSPNFQTSEGSASPDLLRLKTDNTVTIAGPWKWIVLRYTYFHNNLVNADGVNTATTRMPETGLRYEAPDWRPNFSWESRIRARDITSSSDGSRKRTHSLINSVADRFGPLSLQVDYEIQKEDKSDGTVSLLHHILGVGSNSMVMIQKWKVVEGLRWDLQRDRDNLMGTTDQTGTVKANVLVVSPWAVDGGVTYTRMLVINALNPGNDRRSWAASLGANVMHSEDHRVELRYRQNDNRFGTPGQDYKEMTWELSVNDKF